MKVGELQTKPPHILIYGEVGCGKTALALTLGELARVYDLDDGLLTGLKLSDDFTKVRHGVDCKIFVEDDPIKRATIFPRFKKEIFDASNALSKGNFPFQAIIIDSLSSFIAAATDYVMANSGRLGQAPEIQHWGLAFSEAKRVMSVIRAMKIVVVAIGHEKVKTVGKGPNQEERLELAMEGKNLPSQICRYFDEIWYMKATPIGQGKKKYVIMTKGDEIRAARSRANLPDFTDTKVGMISLLKEIGYEFPKAESSDKEAQTVKT